MKKRILALITILLCLCVVLCFASCDDEGKTEETKESKQESTGTTKGDGGTGGADDSSNTPGGGTDESGNTDNSSGGTGTSGDVGDGDDEPVIEKVTITFDGNGGYFGSSATFVQEVEKGKIFTSPSGLLRNGYTFIGWATDIDGSTLWDFSSNVANDNMTLFATWEMQGASILDLEGATISGNEILLVVDKDVEAVSLAKKVVCSTGSTWKLYYDKLGQIEIPTKIAASKTGSLENGNNIFYILVTSENDMNVYTLNVHRSHDVKLSYCFKGEVVYEQTTVSGKELNVSYVPSLKGYEFNYWMDEKTNKVEKIIPFGDTVLYANATAQEYTVSYDTNGGDKLDKEDTVTYDSEFTFVVPTREGYTFTGWKYNSQMVSDGNGYCSKWTYDYNAKLVATWQINNYQVNVKSSNTALGSVSGSGEYKNGSTITISASEKEFCEFVGWFDENDNLVTQEKRYTFTLGTENVNYTAKFVYGTITLNYVVNGEIVGSEEYTVGKHLNELMNYQADGVFMGWYKSSTFSTTDARVSTTEGLVIDGENNAYVYGGTHTGSDSFSFTYSNGEYLVSCGNGSYESIVIPGYFNGLNVVIGGEAFYNKTAITSVEIQEGIKRIGESAFRGCTGLTSIEIPNSVTSIGDSAFYGCTRLTSIEIPNSVTSIGSYAFKGCTGLTSIEIPDSVTSIGDGAFYGCSKLESITIPFVGNTLNGTENTHFRYIFGASEYYENSGYVPASLKSVKITGGNSIGSYAFYDCTGLTSIEIPNSVTSMGNYAFIGCSSLTSIEIPNSVTSIGNSAFRGCTRLESITIPFVGNTLNGTENTHFGYIFGASEYSKNSDYVPASLKSVTVTGGNSIADHAFSSCTWLTNIEIPNSVTSIGGSAFYDCTGLTSIVIPNSVTSIGRYAFDGCTNLKYNEYDNETYLGNQDNPYVVLIKVKDTSIANYKINEQTKIIYDGAFINFSNLKSIEIPNSVTSIGNSAFFYCSSLTSIVIPNSVTSIGYSAFFFCKSLTSIEIPNSVTSISNGAFYGCTGLTSVEIPNSVTSIGSSAFYECTGLTSIEIPNSVESIGDCAFRGCTGLESITIPFVGNTLNGTENTHFGYIFGASKYSENSTYVPASLKSVTVTGGNSIADYAFYKCKGLTSIEIPNSVTEIGSDVFCGCTGLTSIEIPNSVTSIGDSAFSECTGLTSIEIPNSVTSIGDSAFSECTGLTSIEIPDSVTSIGDYAFWGCTGFTSIEIPNSVTGIGRYAFYGCTKLTIYCEAQSQPSGWSSSWNGSNRPVEWGYKIGE